MDLFFREGKRERERESLWACDLASSIVDRQIRNNINNCKEDDDAVDSVALFCGVGFVASFDR